MIHYRRRPNKRSIPVARFCDPNCRDGFICDRQHGAIYPAIHTPEGAYSVERWSLVACTCAYCNAEVPGRAKDLPPTCPAVPPRLPRPSGGPFAPFGYPNP